MFYTNRFSAFLLLVVIVIMVVFPVLALRGLLGSETFSDNTGSETLITPAGYAFVIWGLIYAGLLAFGIFQALPKQQNRPRLRAIRPWVLLNSLFNMAWLVFAANGMLLLTVVLIFGLLFTMISVMDKLQIGRRPVSRAETWLVRFPFAVYTGWLTVATFANTSAYLRSIGFNGPLFGEAGWTVLMLTAGLGIGIFLFRRYHNAAYVMTIVWALVAIAVREPQSDWVRLTATAGTLVFLFLLVRQVWLHKDQPVV